MEIIMFKKTVLKAVVISALLSTTALASQDAVEQFEKDWQNTAFTQAALDPVDVNHVLSTYYTTSKPVKFTREMLWDVERRKAWDPKTYIPHVVSEGKSWGRQIRDNGDETFTRWSHQRQWLTGKYGVVIEKVTLLNKEQRVIFLGASEAEEAPGQILEATVTQPLFHVEHGVDGSEDNPLNTWRIVHLTLEKDQALTKRFDNFRDPTILPIYIEIYIRDVLGIGLTRK
jgi:hypothetical protein